MREKPLYSRPIRVTIENGGGNPIIRVTYCHQYTRRTTVSTVKARLDEVRPRERDFLAKYLTALVAELVRR